jgi:hypothetical protein
LTLLGPTGVSTAPSAGDGVIALTVTTSGTAPAITSGNSTVVAANGAVNVAVTASGSPAPAFALSGAPSWLTINARTGILSGTVPSGVTGSFAFTVAATNYDGKATQQFTLVVTGSSGPCARPTRALCAFVTSRGHTHSAG